MAPRRFLKTLFASNFINLFCVAVISSALIAGCGTTKETQREPGPDPSDNNETIEQTAVDEDLLFAIKTNRSELSDVYSGLKSNIPAVFLQESTAREIGDPNQGYRIQILSTRSVARADSMANDFRTWARREFTNYIPKAYVLFRQPYYKVHVGNFQFQDHAMKLNEVIKTRYTDAWVVPDEVEPELVPPNSLQFQKNK
ncbi:MAG: SPOR domain-containing protein [Balneolaceae bacterium]|nr:SPOR domain-containing protein [Balneolaceae bacterium]